MTKITARVLLDRVLVRPLERAEQKVGALITLTNTAGESAYIGEVVAVGAGRPYIDMVSRGSRRDAYVAADILLTPVPLRVKVGDQVVLGKSPLGVKAGVEVLINGEKFQVVKEDDILVVL